jgi:translation elongation factor EF-G
MGEIKSTWEIVMEKLKQTKITEEDRERFRQEEARDKAKRLFFPYFQGDQRDWDNLKEEAKKLDEEGVKELLNLIVENLSLETLSERYQRGLEVLFGKEGLERIEELLERYRKKQEVETEILKEELLQGFEKRGIRGSAISPNPRVHPRWDRVMEEITVSFKKELRELLEKLPLG